MRPLPPPNVPSFLTVAKLLNDWIVLFGMILVS